MFKLNQPTKTTTGEIVVPYLVEGRIVHAFDSNKKPKMFELNQFNVVSEKKKKVNESNVLMVKGIQLPIEVIDEKIIETIIPKEEVIAETIKEPTQINITPIAATPVTPATPFVPQESGYLGGAYTETITSTKPKTNIPIPPQVTYEDIPVYDIKVDSTIPQKVGTLYGKATTVFVPNSVNIKEVDDFYGDL